MGAFVSLYQEIGDIESQGAKRPVRQKGLSGRRIHYLSRFQQCGSQNRFRNRFQSGSGPVPRPKPCGTGSKFPAPIKGRELVT